MKLIVKHVCNTYSQRIASALVLTTVLSLSSSLMMSDSAVAAPAPQQLAQPALKNQVRPNQLPSQVANAAIADLSRRVGIPAEKLKITKYTQETWPNGCLGIPKPGELCSQALVEGWRITLSDGRKTWIYRSDCQGRVLRLEN